MGISIANESGVSRRSFLTAAGIGAAGIIGASMLPGCSNKKGESAEGDAWDLETDIVVVGSGAAGVAAAVTAIEEGAEVVMVEKADLIGGATSATVQYCAPTSSLAIPQNFDDVTDSAELMFENAMEVSEGTADPSLVKIWCDGAADAIDWMIDHGCEFKETLKICEGRQGQGKYIAKTAGELTTKLIPIIQEKATLLNNCPLESLVANEEGRIIGAICLDGGKEKRIRARKAVIICSGPWTNDEVMIPRHMNDCRKRPLRLERPSLHWACPMVRLPAKRFVRPKRPALPFAIWSTACPNRAIRLRTSCRRVLPLQVSPVSLGRSW